jgi:hypothetical protein
VHSRRSFSHRNHHRNPLPYNRTLHISLKLLQDFYNLMFPRLLQFHSSLLLLSRICTINNPSSQRGNFFHSSNVPANRSITRHPSNYTTHPLNIYRLRKDKNSMDLARNIAALSRFPNPRNSSHLHSRLPPFQAR